MIAQLGKALEGKKLGIAVEPQPSGSESIDVTPIGVNSRGGTRV